MRTLLVLPLLAACGGGGPTHWKDQPIETVSATFKGHAYTIDLPKGMKKSDITDYQDDYSYHAEVRGESYTFAPSVGVGWHDKKTTLDEALKGDTTKTIVDKQQTADGWVYAYENDSRKGEDDYMIIAEKFVGDAAFSCLARVYPMKKGDGGGKDLIPLVEKMCLSIKGK